jgi:tight adherence protein B
MLIALTVILTAGSVFLSCLVMLRIGARAYERYRERYLGSAAIQLSELFLFIDPRQVWMLNVSAFFLLAALGYLLFGPAIACAGALLGFFSPMWGLKLMRRRRIRKLNRQLVDVLQAVANALKAGLTFPQAAEQIAKEAAPPLSQELGLLVKEIKLGVPMEEALIGMGERVGSPDLDLVVISTNIARQLGGNLAEMFEGISNTMRERFRLEGKIDAITSQGRMQGWIVAAMPLALGAGLSAMRPDLMQPMFAHWFGYVLVGAVAVMDLAGIAIIKRIVAIDV